MSWNKGLITLKKTRMCLRKSYKEQAYIWMLI